MAQTCAGALRTAHYERPRRYTVAVEVIDIFGNATITVVQVHVGWCRTVGCPEGLVGCGRDMRAGAG